MQTLHIIKIGGNILDSPAKLESFLLDFAALPEPKLLIHGGGKIASTIGKKLGIEPNMVEGRRITDAETLKLVTMVYAGLVNKNVVAQLQSMSCNAIGLTGADANIIPASKRPVKQIDYGFVGDVAGPETINATVLDTFLKSGLTPVCAPLTHDKVGNLLNTNADTIASVLATAMAHLYQVKLIYCFEKKGVLQDADNDESVISRINKKSYKQLKEDGIVTLGMIPKLDNAFAALDQGVSAVIIGDAAEINTIVAGGEAGTLISL
ncbi:acetylglutamate kinase [Pontibacter sp. 13R65]|uniref:acetylglutamate kinase n=1 Tax=Pontibacter sp. 13R65 TaxID=3127458 RepID=UPI00301C2BE9